MPSSGQILLTAVQLGKLLRAARKQHGLTQAEVGARLGLSQNRVSYLEAHAQDISTKQLLTWCAVVGLELYLQPRPGQTQEAAAPGSDVSTPSEW